MSPRCTTAGVRAHASALTPADFYASGVKVLGFSAAEAGLQARKVLVYIPGRVSERTLCELESLGWELEPRPLIRPPREGVQQQFVDQYTKLHVRDHDRICLC